MNNIHTRPERDSAFELLRIISMFLIVASHYSVHGILSHSLGIVNPVYSSLPMGGTLGVNCFVLITGYFTINSSLTFGKIARLLYQVLCMTALISFAAYCVGAPYFELSTKHLIKSSIGILGNYWFINTYLVLILLSPFINKMLKNINQQEHCLCILTLVGLNYLAPFFRIPTYFHSVGQFITLYSIAAFIRMYGSSWRLSLSKFSLLTILLLVVGFLMIWLALQHRILGSIFFPFVVAHSSLYLLLISSLIFVIFTRIHIRHSRIINFLAACTLGIYIFHEHALMRTFLWNTMLHCERAPFSAYPYFHCIASILLVFFLSIVADVIFRYTIGYLYSPLNRYILNPVYSTIKSKILNFYHKIQSAD